MRVCDIETWYLQHYEVVKKCTSCGLYATCLQNVPGHGNLTSKLMIIGEAPGADEDLQGKPFVGKSGQLLNKLLKEAGLHRDDFYVTNYCKCRPPNNRVPSGFELHVCKRHLVNELLILNPVVVVSLGYTATYCTVIAHFTGAQIDTIGKARRRVWVNKFNDTVRILYPTYHPSFILRSPNWRHDVVEDFKILKRYIDNGYNISTLNRAVTRTPQR